MKCPDCGDVTEQQRLASGSRSRTHHCGKCGQLYAVPIKDLAATIDRLEELKANAEWLANQHALLVERIAEVEAQIKATRGE
jgi:transcription elongation factor Elf1